MDSFRKSLRDLPVIGYFLRVVYAVWKLPEMWDIFTGAVPVARPPRDAGATQGVSDLTARVIDLTALVKEQASEMSQYQRRADGFAPIYVGRERLLIRTQPGPILMCNAQDIQLTPQLIERRVWEPALTAFYSQNIALGMKYLEIGSNIGYFTVLASFLVGHTGRVHAFEPDPTAFSLLRINCRLNHCSYLCELSPLAVSDVAGPRTLHRFEHNFGSSSLSELPEHLLTEFCEEPSLQSVECTTLDEHYRDRDVVFDFVKIDAEGAEPLIFLGAQDFLRRCTRDTTIFAVEFNPQAMKGLGKDGRQFLDRLLQSGFFVWQLSERGELRQLSDPGGLDTWCNAELILSRNIDALKVKPATAL
jgi:FkbM family methyltransferase